MAGVFVPVFVPEVVPVFVPVFVNRRRLGHGRCVCP